MQNRLSIITLLSLIVVLAGCWKQHDVISIKSDGTTTFKTEVVITDKEFSQEDIEKLTSEFMELLTSAGWRVDKKWLSRSKPFKLSFSGHGNIRQVKNATDFYTIEKLTESTYKIRFTAAESKGGKSSRSIKFEHGFFGGAKVIDAQGNEVKEIQNVSDNQTYRIIF